MCISYRVLPLPYLALVILSSTLALTVYLRFSRHQQCKKNYAHVIVHVASNVGVLLYTSGVVARRGDDGIS
jgi:hypothetical protein